jgi:Putative beta-barrel porin-2, OmpL-like. bbp2
MHRRLVCVCVCVWLGAPAFLARAQTAAGGLEDLTGESAVPVQITGFGVGDFRADGRTRENGFDAGKLAVGLFRELNEHLWIFGQITTAVTEPKRGAEEASTEIEIDNLIVNATPPTWSSVSVSFGKFDTPLGFERDDEPLNLQATTSDNFDLARPAKQVGLIGRWAASRTVDVSAWVANGWQSDLESNHGKTVGGRIGFRPSDRVSVGAGFLDGPEGEQGATRNRYLVTLDYAAQPTDAWIVGGETNYGGDRANAGLDAGRWYGATATVFRRFTGTFGTTARLEGFKDRDGARTGEPQTLTSFTIAPIYFIGTGGEGIFATIEHTTFRIPRFQLRGEVRWDHSTIDAFETRSGDAPWTVHYVAQLVTTF